MKSVYITVVFSFLVSLSQAQINTEIHVFDILKTSDGFTLKNGKNISNNKGYDSQPYFYDSHQVVFSSNREGNTDICWYHLENDEKRFISATKEGGEYSPQRIPNSKDISAVRLDTDGLQRFYRYEFKSGKSKEILPHLKVAYPTWYDKNTLVSSVIINDSLHLVVSNLKEQTNTTVAKEVGRAVHRIPNSNLISFIDKSTEKNLVKSLDPKTGEIKSLLNIGDCEDITWLPNGTILYSDGYALYQFNPKKDNRPMLFFRFVDEDIINISRLAVNDKGTKLALVAEVSPEYLAQEQLEAYNNRDIDAFLKPFAKNVQVYRYPNKLSYEGIENMRKRYEGYFKNTPDLHCKILKRIVFKNTVIDHELVTRRGSTVKAVAIYEMNGGKITKVTFL